MKIFKVMECCDTEEDEWVVVKMFSDLGDAKDFKNILKSGSPYTNFEVEIDGVIEKVREEICYGKKENEIVKIPFKWETIEDVNNLLPTKRAKVIGGWIINTIVIAKHTAMSSVFVSDPTHAWEIDNEKI